MRGRRRLHAAGPAKLAWLLQGWAAGEPRGPRLAGARPVTDLAALRAVVALDGPPSLQGHYAGLLATFAPTLPVTTQGGSFQLWAPADPLGCSLGPGPRKKQGLPVVAVVRRGTCTFLRKAELAKDAGAQGVVIASDSEDLQVMSAGNASRSEGLEPEVGIFVVSVAKSLGDALLSAELGPEGLDARLSIAAYRPWPVDVPEAMLVLLATALVAAGAFFATADLRGSPLAPRHDEVLEVNKEVAVGFCVLGSCTLLVLYVFMRYLIYFLIFAFCLGGASCIVQFVSACLQYLNPALKQRAVGLPLVGPVTKGELLALVPAVAVVGSWLLLRNGPSGWIFQDIIGAGFLCWLQRTIRLPNMKIASLLLSVMFFFDIFWVFISPLFFQKSVMVAVATGGDTGEAVPMLLRIPAFGDIFGHDRMLGFGDVALPGLLVSYLRRYDLVNRRPCLRGYFAAALLGYFAGLCATVAALVLMRKGQPALLYLVPGTLGTSLALAWWRRELPSLWEGTPAPNGGCNGGPAANVRPEAEKVGAVQEVKGLTEAVDEDRP